MDEDTATFLALHATSPWTALKFHAAWRSRLRRVGAWTRCADACGVEAGAGVHVGAGRRLEERRFADGDVFPVVEMMQVANT
jgi:hypothetical protein